MGFARGMALGMQQLPSLMLHNRELNREKKLGLAMADMARGMEQETKIRDREADPNFVGPPRAPLDGSDVPEGMSRREAARVGTHDVQAAMARVYAEHGRPDAAATMLSRSAASRERRDERAYQRGRDAKVDARQATADERAQAEFDRKRLTWTREDARQATADERAQAEFDRKRLTWTREDEQRAFADLYSALESGDDRIIGSALKKHGHMLELGEGREPIGVDLVRGPDGQAMAAVRIRNAKTGTEGPMTERASADPDDKVVAVPLSYIRQRAGVQPKTGKFSESARGVINQETGEFTPHDSSTPGVGGAGAQPADVQTAEWLIAQGVAENPHQAWAMVREGRSDPNAFVQRYVTAAMEAQAKQFVRPGSRAYRDQNQLVDEALGMLDRIREGTRSQGAGSKPGRGASGDFLDSVVRSAREGRSPLERLSAGRASLPGPHATSFPSGGALDSASGQETTAQSATQEAPPAPINPQEREIGKVYSTRDGRRVQWDGEGWLLVEE